MSERTVVRSRGTDRTADGEDLHVRNYDDERHEVRVRVVPEDDGAVGREYEYDLAPEARAGERDALPPGEYVVEVELDGLRRWTARCEVTGDATSGVLVETGNGTVSVADRIVG